MLLGREKQQQCQLPASPLHQNRLHSLDVQPPASRLCCCKSLCGGSDSSHKKDDDIHCVPEQDGLLDDEGDARESSHASDALTEEQLQRLVEDQMDSLKALDLTISGGKKTPGKPRFHSGVRSPIGADDTSMECRRKQQKTVDSTSLQLDPSENIAAMEADLDKFLAQMESTEPPRHQAPDLEYEEPDKAAAGAHEEDDDVVLEMGNDGEKVVTAVTSGSESPESEDRGQQEAKGESPTPKKQRKKNKRKNKKKKKNQRNKSKEKEKKILDHGEVIGADGIIDC